MLKIFSYNIQHGEGMDGQIDLPRIARVIAKISPDLVALQEVDKGCTRSGNQDIAAELGLLLHMDHRFDPFMDFQGGEYGMAILSRLPILETVRHPLPAGDEPRCALEVQVDAPDVQGPLSFVCIHNDWMDEATRVKQMCALLTSLQGTDHPVILAGDFNGDRTDESMKLLEKTHWEILEKRGLKTWPADDPDIELDYFALRGFPKAVIEHNVIDERMASDHRPIAAVITVQEKE